MSGTPREFQPSLLRKMTREPLVGFALAAAAIFGLFGAFAEPEQDVIVLSPVSVQLMIENREAMLGRNLTEEERVVLIRELADQEVLVREAVKLGLYMHDPKTRKRLIDQMHFLMAKKAPKPTAQDLERLRTDRPDRYVFPSTISFEHVYYASDPAAAQTMARNLKSGAPALAEAGDRFWLGRDLEAYTDSQLLMLLGHGFVRDIRALTPGVWSEPIKSARGWHVVRVTAFNDPTPLPQHELDRRLQEDWEIEYRRRTYDTQLAQMRRHYRVELSGSAEPRDLVAAELSRNPQSVKR